MRWILYLLVLMLLHSNLGLAQTNDTLVFKQYKDQKTIVLLDTIINGNTLKLEYHIDTFFRDYMVDNKKYPLFIKYNNLIDSFYTYETDDTNEMNSYKNIYDEQTFRFTSLAHMYIIEHGKVHHERLYYNPNYFSFVMNYGVGYIMVFVNIKDRLKISNRIPVLQDNFILFPEYKTLGFPHDVGYFAHRTILIRYDDRFNFYGCKVIMPCIPEGDDFSKLLSSYKKYMPKIVNCKTSVKYFDPYFGKYYFGFH